MVTWRRWARECHWQHVAPMMLRLAQPGHEYWELLSRATRIFVRASVLLLINLPSPSPVVTSDTRLLDLKQIIPLPHHFRFHCPQWWCDHWSRCCAHCCDRCCDRCPTRLFWIVQKNDNLFVWTMLYIFSMYRKPGRCRCSLRWAGPQVLVPALARRPQASSWGTPNLEIFWRTCIRNYEKLKNVIWRNIHF